jgi:hypothetical protein
VRILPGALHADAILKNARLIERLLERCLDPTPFPAPPQDPAAAEEELLQVAFALGRYTRIG